jgi:DNA-directed RNA polymerase specialized sigma24 family protein
VSVESSGASSELELRVRRAVDQLSDLDREIFRLIHWEELTHEEVGLSVGITAKAVERRVARARKKVRDYLASLDKFITPNVPAQRIRNTPLYPNERTIAS